METKDNSQTSDDVANDSPTDITLNSNDLLYMRSKHKEKENKYELSIELKKKIDEFPEIIEFIKMLQKCIEKQKKKLKKFKKEKLKTTTVSTQTESCLVVKPNDSASIPTNTPNIIKSVTEEITEAAQQALQTNGFVYEETSGLYYDYNSGYYYNAEYGLYYDGNTGTYLKYNQETKEYEFHSQTDVEVVKNDDGHCETIEQRNKHAKRRGKKRQKPKRDELHDQDEDYVSSALKMKYKDNAPNQLDIELEDGECSDFSETTSSCSDEQDIESDIDHSKQYPPCMRIIVEETSIASLKLGSLHMITFEGGTIGREGSHALLLPEINTSKYHAKITYDSEKGAYFISDVGSRNGTFLNGKRIAPAKVESEPEEVPHGSRVQIGSSILLCHVHIGSQTCGHCEPGLLKNLQQNQNKDGSAEQQINVTKSSEHKYQLKQLRKKFGLSQNDQGKTVPGSGYKDRAMHRRGTVGSQNPHEKTQTASLNESIASNNKGFKLLAKMGWKEGQALGKDSQGLLEPIELVSNPGTSGMGSTTDTKVIQPTTDFHLLPNNALQKRSAKQNSWSKTQERYKQAQVISEPENIFDLTDI